MKGAYALAGLALVLSAGALFFGGSKTVVQEFGAAPGPSSYEFQDFEAGFVEGGGVYASSTLVATETLTAEVLRKNKVLRFYGSTTNDGAGTAAVAAITVTLPATTTMGSVLKDPGDTRSWIIENGYTAAATTTTIAAGTGIDLQEPDGQNVVIGINNYAWLTCFREKSATGSPGDIVCNVDETIPAD